MPTGRGARVSMSSRISLGYFKVVKLLYIYFNNLM